jgi:DNA (cytosine-5)-methyltransferase 1
VGTSLPQPKKNVLLNRQFIAKIKQETWIAHSRCDKGCDVKQTPKSKKTIRSSISLFSGALGLDLGLEAAGFSLHLALEKDHAAVETIRLNRKRLPVMDRSITEVSSQEILAASGLKQEELALISAGPCCQSFSTAGKRHSVKDPRGNLFFNFRDVVRDLRPRFFVMENVKGMLSAAVHHRPLDERGAGFPLLTRDEQLGSGLDLIRDELSKLGYYVIFGLLNAANFGVPQKRWRVFFIGSRDGEDLHLPEETHCAPDLCDQTGLPAWETLKAALDGVKSKKWCEFTEDRRSLLSQLKTGQNWRDLPERLHRRALGAALDSWGFAGVSHGTSPLLL